MGTLPQTSPVLTPQGVERASKRDGKTYELIDGRLKEKAGGFYSLLVAGQICQRLNARFYPETGFAVSRGMIYCFGNRRQGRKPDVVFVRLARVEGQIPRGDLFVAPDLVAEVMSAKDRALDVERMLNDYCEARIPLVWLVNPNRRWIRVFRDDGTTSLFREQDVIENEPTLPGFRMRVGDIFPTNAIAPE